jgi:MFS family permease
MLRNHPLFQTLRELKGNPRVTVLTEIMFGIPYNLFAPFFSVYMLALGLTDQQIGSIASLGLVFQIFTALLSGVIVDKFGRRLSLLIFDLLCWSVPCLIWAVAQDVRFFVVAALMNSLWRVSLTAWTCLMVEDAEERHLVHIWTDHDLRRLFSFLYLTGRLGGGTLWPDTGGTRTVRVRLHRADRQIRHPLCVFT